MGKKSIIPGKEGKSIVPLSQIYRSQKNKTKLIKIIRAEENDIIKKSLLTQKLLRMT